MKTEGKSTADVSDVLELFKQVMTKKLAKSRRIYTEQLVCWLLVLQHLSSNKSVRGVVPAVLTAQAQEFLGNCKRVREGKISLNSGAYCQARKLLPQEALRHILEELFAILSKKTPRWKKRRVVCLDGTTLRLSPRQSLALHYPPATIPHIRSPFPILFVLLVHDVLSGLALEPESGPMYGPNATSEAKMARKVFARLEPGNVIVADRAFGVFSVVFHAFQHKHDVIFRLTEPRARKLLGRTISRSGCYPVTWTSSVHDLSTNPHIPRDASVRGTLVAQHVRHEGKTQLLYLFTTIPQPDTKDILSLYARRWEIETDIRYLKVPFELQDMTSNSPEMVQKELLSAIISYNLVRAVMILAGNFHQRDPKKFSFTFIYRALKDASLSMIFASSETERKKLFRFIIATAIAGYNSPDPRRSRPRTAYKRRHKYPYRKAPPLVVNKN